MNEITNNLRLSFTFQTQNGFNYFSQKELNMNKDFEGVRFQQKWEVDCWSMLFPSNLFCAVQSSSNLDRSLIVGFQTFTDQQMVWDVSAFFTLNVHRYAYFLPIYSKNLLEFFFRHEPPVVGNPLEIIELTDELVVLNKPSSIPVGWNLILITK